MLSKSDAKTITRFVYDRETGLFERNGRPVGTKNKNGYIVMRFFGKLYYAHRLAWHFVHGRFPDVDIDHINGIRHDNRIANLREATRQQNLRNKKCRNATGFKGVIVHRDKNRKKRFGAQIKPDKYVFLGWYATPEEAHAAYVEAAKRMYGEFARF